MNKIALYHGKPVREQLLSYCAHPIEPDDVAAVVDVPQQSKAILY